MKSDILAFGAHPDDTELGCSGTLASLVKAGHRVVVVDLTRGEMGTRGTPETRKEEAERAARILGLHARENLDLPDTELENSRIFQLPIIHTVRHYRPHICILGAPKDRHPDHGKATRLLIDALFYSGLQKIVTNEPDGTAQEPHRPAHILHYMQDQPFDPDFVFDITDTIDLKERAIRAFSTQFDISNPGKEPETYISNPEFFQSVRARARFYGHQSGFSYGEPFLYASRPIPIRSMSIFEETSPRR